MRGRCFCGQITFEKTEPVQACVTCHCERSRRQCSAPMTAYVGVLGTQWQWLTRAPKVFRSSPGVERSFCADCGTPLSFRSDKMSGTMHFCVASLEAPEKFAATLHVAHEEKLPWLNLNDALPICIGPEYTKA